MADPSGEKRKRDEDDLAMPDAKRVREVASEDLPGLWSDEFECTLPATFLLQLARYLEEGDLAYLGSASPELLKVALYEHGRRPRHAARCNVLLKFKEEPLVIDWRFATRSEKRILEAIEKNRPRYDVQNMGDGAAGDGNMPVVLELMKTRGYIAGASTAWWAAAYNKPTFLKEMLASRKFNLFVDEKVLLIAGANGHIEVLEAMLANRGSRNARWCEWRFLNNRTGYHDGGYVGEQTAITAIVSGAVGKNRVEPLVWLFANSSVTLNNVWDEFVLCDEEPSHEMMVFVADLILADIPQDEFPPSPEERKASRLLMIFKQVLEGGKRKFGEFLITERGAAIPRDAFAVAALAQKYEWAESLVTRTTFDSRMPLITSTVIEVNEAAIGSGILLSRAAKFRNFGAWEWGCSRGYEAISAHLTIAAEADSLEIVQWFYADRPVIFLAEIWTTWSAACVGGAIKVVEWMLSHKEWRDVVNLESMCDAITGATLSVKQTMAAWRRNYWSRISLVHLANEPKPE